MREGKKCALLKKKKKKITIDTLEEDKEGVVPSRRFGIIDL